MLLSVLLFSSADDLKIFFKKFKAADGDDDDENDAAGDGDGGENGVDVDDSADLVKEEEDERHFKRERHNIRGVFFFWPCDVIGVRCGVPALLCNLEK